MNTFKEYSMLVEGKERFIKRNKYLTPDQKDEVIKFFQANRQYENKVDWNKAHSMTYDEFTAIMVQSRSGRRTVLKHQAIKGSKEGSDYVQVRMPTKEFLAYIPLNFETAQKFNTREMGVCSGPWCIGHSDTSYHWNDEVISEQQVPIYVINRFSKWVVMIKDGNQKYDVWSVENNPRKVREGIPDFSIRKNLLSPAQKKMYDEIREEFFQDEAEEPEIDISDAEDAYNELVSDIETAREEWEAADENFYRECQDIKDATLDRYNDTLEEAKERVEDLQAQFDEAESLLSDLESETEEWVDNGEEGIEPYVLLDGEELILDDLNAAIKRLEDEKDDAEDDVSKIEDDISTIENIEPYEMAEEYDINWTEDPPSEDYKYDSVSVPSISHGIYSDYIDLMEEHGYVDSRHSDVDTDIYSYVMGETSHRETAESILSNHGFYHPEVVNQR